MTQERRLDAVFEGGGVKGIALVGAVKEVEERGFQFENVAGTSAGAIVAALIAAGYTANEIKEEMNRLDYSRFKDKSLMDKVPFIGPMLSLGFEKGIYEGKYFESWLQEMLSAKKVKYFGDLVMEPYKDDPQFRWKLQVIATDLSNKTLLRLPRDLDKYKADPDEFEVAKAVRMSMGIPFFFEPVELEDNAGDRCVIVDGGVLSNYPVWIFDDNSPNPAWPTIGFKLVEDGENTGVAVHKNINGPISMLAALFSTMLDAHDKFYIQDKNFARTIPIPTLGVQTTDFDLDHEKAESLFESGNQAAKKFFEQWSFDQWKTNYRDKNSPGRQQRLLRQKTAK